MTALAVILDTLVHFRHFIFFEIRYSNLYKMLDMTYKKGFTLVELLVALIVSSIILAAVATLAFAMSTANVSTDDTSVKQAQVRFATLRISELIRHCKLICGMPGSYLTLWRADDNSDNKININEIIFLEKGQDADFLKLYDFSSAAATEMTLSQISDISPADYGVEAVTLIPQCSNLVFEDEDGAPPDTKTGFVSISFDLVENDVVKHYQINAALRGWAGNLLDEAGTEIVSDDD
jgi:prepilin-type N-terminal cleavage/methylation domain-containing protein